MAKQMDFTEHQPEGISEEKPARGKGRRRRAASAPGSEPATTSTTDASGAEAGAGAGPPKSEPRKSPPESEAETSRPAAGAEASRGSATSSGGEPLATGSEPGEFQDVAHLTKKGLRVVPVVTGAVVDPAGNFLFYVDGHEDARSGVQAQINHLLASGPAREEHLAPARARARELLDRLTRPR